MRARQTQQPCNYLADKAKAYNSSELLALNDHELLVLERDGKGLGDDSKAVVKRIYKIDLAGAQDVANDNDFLATTPAGRANPNQWFIFAFTEADLGGSAFVNLKWVGRP